MKIFDCFMYFDEDLVLDVRLNFLDKFVDKFERFKHKIQYILVNKIPLGIEKINIDEDKNELYRKSIFNAWKRENLQRNQISKGLLDANEEDWIIISDLDEIPDLSQLNLKNINDSFVFFKQDMMYYKFNLKLEDFIWVGSKACKMKNLESPQWIRDIKNNKYQWWRLDTYFSKKKYRNIFFVENGGWHFSYLKSPKDIEKKLQSYLHHIDYDLNPVGEKGIEKMINNKRTIYNLKADQREKKFDGANKLIKININSLPSYIMENKNKLKDWIEE